MLSHIWDTERLLVNYVSVQTEITPVQSFHGHLNIMMCSCISICWFILLQSDVWSSASFLEGAASASGWFWRAAPQWALWSSYRSHPCPALPAGRRAHLLRYGPGEAVAHERGYSIYSVYIVFNNILDLCRLFIIFTVFRSSLRLKAVWSSCVRCTMYLASPSNWTSPPDQRSSLGNLKSGIRLRR